MKAEHSANIPRDLRGLTRTERLSKRLLEHFRYGGVTLSPEGNVITEGIAVALSKTSEHTVPYKSKQYVKGYIWRWLEQISGDNALGFWIDDEDHEDTVYLDEVKIFPTYAIKEAIHYAIQHDQIAVQLLNPNITLRIK